MFSLKELCRTKDGGEQEEDHDGEPLMTPLWAFATVDASAWAISGLRRRVPAILAISYFCGHNLAIFCQHDVLEEMKALRSPQLIAFSLNLEDGIRSEECFDFGVLGVLKAEKVEMVEDVGRIEEFGDWKEL